jgi:hypothetical protein
MLNQTSATEITSEEILQQMIRETFEVPKIEKPASEKNFPGAGFSQQIEMYAESKENLLVQRLVSYYAGSPSSLLPSCSSSATSRVESVFAEAVLPSYR